MSVMRAAAGTSCKMFIYGWFQHGLISKGLTEGALRAWMSGKHACLHAGKL